MNHKQIPKGFLRFIVIPNFLKAANAFGAANAGKIFIRDDSSGFVKTSNESAPLFFSRFNLVGDDTKAVPELDIKASLALFVEASALFRVGL